MRVTYLVVSAGPVHDGVLVGDADVADDMLEAHSDLAAEALREVLCGELVGKGEGYTIVHGVDGGHCLTLRVGVGHGDDGGWVGFG